MFCDLCVMLIEGIKHLYEALKSDYKLGNGVVISREQKMKKNSNCFSNLSQCASSDLIDHLTISSESMRINQVNMRKRKLSIIYKKPSLTFDEKETYDHRISNLLSYKSFNIYESSSKHHIHCESYINKQLCK